MRQTLASQASDVGPSVCRLTLALCAALRRGGDNRRTGVRATDADISVCRLRTEGGDRLA
jgi:hypothetical protein